MFDYPVAGASVPATGPTVEGADVALKEYDVVIDGNRTTVQLSEHDARAMGVWIDEPAAVKVAPAPKNKMRKARNKAS